MWVCPEKAAEGTFLSFSVTKNHKFTALVNGLVGYQECAGASEINAGIKDM